MNHNSSQKKYNCRLCQSEDIISVFKLASTPPANAFISRDKLKIKQKKYPLEIFFCNKCSHVQLTDVVDPKELFENYVFYFLRCLL